MRRIALLSLLLVTMMCIATGGAAVAAKSMRMPVDPAAVGLTDHQLTGDWVVITPAGEVPVTLGTDGSILLEFPTSAFGRDGFAFVSYAVGTWTPLGARGAAFTAVQMISHANGVYLGTVTLDGYLTARDDPSLTGVVASVSTITIRDANDTIISIANAGDAMTALTATRVAPAARPAAVNLTSPDALLGNGGQDCAWCAAAVAGSAPVASGALAEVGPAEARYIAAKDAALEPVAPAPVTPRFGGGCNTCR